MRVLLAIPDTDLRLAIELALSQEPSVTLAGAASEPAGFQALLHTTQPDLIVLDWSLCGRECTALMAALPHRPRVLALVRRTDEQMQALAAGADAAVSLGAPPEHLLTCFRELRQRP